MSITLFKNILVVLPCVIQSTAIELYTQKESNMNQVRPYFEQSCFGFLFKTVLEDFVTSPGCLQGVSMNFQGVLMRKPQGPKYDDVSLHYI